LTLGVQTSLIVLMGWEKPYLFGVHFIV